MPVPRTDHIKWSQLKYLCGGKKYFMSDFAVKRK